MRDHSKHVEVSHHDAVDMLLANCSFEPKVETVQLSEAYGRVLAHDVVSQLDMPNCLTCRMDSVAVRWADFENGMPDTTGWKRGEQWEFANTGIGMPVGYDTAVVVEQVELSDDLSQIRFKNAPSKIFAGTSQPGSRLKKGQVLATAGAKLTPLLVSYIASGNNTEVDVLAKPRVAFIPTGNELVSAGSELERGKNIETNSYLIAGKIAAWGGEAIIHDVVPDDTELIKQAVADCCAKADIVILNAGSSKGSDDWNVEMLEEMGTILYHQTNHGPGRHSSGAIVDRTPVVGISGPPGGASFTTDFYVYPLMQKYFGADVNLPVVTARLAEAFPAGSHSKKRPEGADRKIPPDAFVEAPVTKGEQRPSVAKYGSEFFSIQQVSLSVAEDGILEARPVGSSHPSVPQANGATGYFASSSLYYDAEVGDLLQIELRPLIDIASSQTLDC